ncbi:MAG: LysE family transporter, partial [Methylocystaceae bacterium]
FRALFFAAAGEKKSDKMSTCTIFGGKLVSLLALLGTAFMVGLSGALMPGPLLTVTITETARRGFRVAPQLMLGHALLELVLVVALVTGLAALLAYEAVSGVIGLIGGAFLLYLGWGMVKEAYQGTLSLTTAASEDQAIMGTGLHPIITGAVVSLSNPYWSLWWVTVGLGYVTIALGKGTAGVAAFYSGHIMADFAWYMAVAGAVAGGRKFLSNSVYRAVIGVCGLFLLGLGLYFIRYGYYIII